MAPRRTWHTACHSCYLRMNAIDGGDWDSVSSVAVYVVLGLFKNAESRGRDDESCGPPAGAVERGGPFQPHGKNRKPKESGRRAPGLLEGQGHLGCFQQLCRLGRTTRYDVSRNVRRFHSSHFRVNARKCAGNKRSSLRSWVRYEKMNTCVSVPFDEDDKDKSVWFLDHDYLENMYGMFKKVNGKEGMEFRANACRFLLGARILIAISYVDS